MARKDKYFTNAEMLKKVKKPKKKKRKLSDHQKKFGLAVRIAHRDTKTPKSFGSKIRSLLKKSLATLRGMK